MGLPSLVATLAVQGLGKVGAGLTAAEGLVVETVAVALAPWKPTWLVVSLRRRSLFSAVKYVQNSGKVLVVLLRERQISQAAVRTPVDSKSRNVKSRMAWSEIESPPTVAM